MIQYSQSASITFLEARLQQIAEWPEDSTINLRVIAKQALRDYYEALRVHYVNEATKDV